MAISIRGHVVILLAFLFLSCILAGCASAQTSEVVTDETVLRTLEKLRGGDWSRDEICIKRLNEPAKLAIVGVKDEKSTCSLDGLFVDRAYFVHGKPEWSRNALNALGWETANRAQRENLARLLVEKVLFAFSTKSSQTFRAVPFGEDEIKVIVSLQLPPGVTSRNAPKIFVFDRNGKMSPAGNY